MMRTWIGTLVARIAAIMEPRQARSCGGNERHGPADHQDRCFLFNVGAPSGASGFTAAKIPAAKPPEGYHRYRAWMLTVFIRQAMFKPLSRSDTTAGRRIASREQSRRHNHKSCRCRVDENSSLRLHVSRLIQIDACSPRLSKPSLCDRYRQRSLLRP